MATTTYQVILSTDGKHTVLVTTDAMPATDTAIAWAKATYERLVKRYGLKHEQRQPAAQLDGPDAGEDVQVPECAVHHVPMVRVEGKYGPFWSCHERGEDGSFCSYRPTGA
jgi:hypothetical protein